MTKHLYIIAASVFLISVGTFAGSKKDKSKKTILESDDEWTLEAHIYGRWSAFRNEEIQLVTDENQSPVFDENGMPVTAANTVTGNEFSMERSRIKFSWEPSDWVTAVLQVGDFHKASETLSILKDAYIEIAPSKQFQFRAGQFKKSFSRLELRGSRGMKIPEKGIGNSLIIAHYNVEHLGAILEEDRLQYGDRDLGILFSGRLIDSQKLDYEVGVYNGTGPILTRKSKSKDAAARLEISPIAGIKLGVNGSIKFFEKDEQKPANGDRTILRSPGWAVGADALIEAPKGIQLHLEALAALDYRVTDQKTPLVLNVIAVLSYRKDFNVSWKLAVEPATQIEFLDPSSVFIDDLVSRYGAGFNLYFGKWVRFLVHGVTQRASRNAGASLNKKRNRYSGDTLSIQVCFDWK